MQRFGRFARVAGLLSVLAVAVTADLGSRVFPRLILPGSTAARVLPALRYGFVMFDRIPDTLAVYDYARCAETRFSPIGQLDPYDWALGHAQSRVQLLLMLDPPYLAHLCRARLHGCGEIRQRVFRTEPELHLVRESLVDCKEVGLR